jgi:hypothetical protein
LDQNLPEDQQEVPKVGIDQDLIQEWQLIVSLLDLPLPLDLS